MASSLAASPPAAIPLPAPMSLTPAEMAVASSGLDAAEAARRLLQFGPNSLPDGATHPLSRALRKLWSPIPWMLEAAIILQLVMGRDLEALIIACLLAFNAALGFIQDGRAQATLDALRSHLALTSWVRRSGTWLLRPAVELVVGDLVQLSLGAVVPADVTLISGALLVDQSMLTGESLGTEAVSGSPVYAGGLVRRGEATGRVMATAGRTHFGRAAQLVRTAGGVSTQQRAVLHLVRNLACCNGALILALVIYAQLHGVRWGETVPLVLTAVLASIPVALPATFTLASAVAARGLATLGVLPTRLSAVDEAASIDCLCIDKTGTLTQNQLALARVDPLAGGTREQVLLLANLASAQAGSDPVDQAIRAAASEPATPPAPSHSTSPSPSPSPPALRLISFTPFDPAAKMSSAQVVDAEHGERRIIKGAFAVVSRLAQADATALQRCQQLESQGYRVLAVAIGTRERMTLQGLLSLSDPPREDAPALISRLRALGICPVMLTGDAPTTAATVARLVGLTGTVFAGSELPVSLHPQEYAVFAGIAPEDKFHLVQALQRSGHMVGMCGDGANDAPALRQAQIGVAVSTATDVARSAAGVVLTRPGLAGVVCAVEAGRMTFQRILTYALVSMTKKMVQVLFLAIGLIMTGHAILTPILMIIVMLSGDVLGMALTSDRVHPSPMPNRWDIRAITQVGICMGACELLFCVGMLMIGHWVLHLGTATLQTLTFLTLVCANQATTYCLRARGKIWSAPHPSRVLQASSALDIAIALVLAACGVLMAPVGWTLGLGILLAAASFVLVSDQVKQVVFRRLRIS
jgi:H+-transporting ATPase